jgi:hypothetical protein
MRRVLGGIVCLVAGCGRIHFELIGGDGDAGADANGDGDGGSSSATYVATIAECTDPGAPDPAFCRSVNGNTELPVDQNDDNLNVPFYSYLRFDFDNAIAGREVVAVTLRLVISDGAESDGPMTGEVWRVATFTLADLSTQAPAQLGGAPLAGDQGAVLQLQPVQWTLPTSVIDGGPLCLGLIPISASGVNYWNLQGADPPRVDLELR